MDLKLVYVTFPSRGAAAVLGQSALEQGLAACMNIHAIESMYMWKGTMEKGDECVALFKTLSSHEQRLRACIEKGHPYEVPCILSWTVQVNASYANWVKSCLIDL
ncbi:MAG: divalent-cation tolerance protein CutA [Saprospiraceae bacterium]|nr:divalent-cation tolerance protein CutA [Saprospiraceae bacterium]